MKNIKKILQKRILILDGATGTELQKRGMPQGVCPEAWCIENPEALMGVYDDYCKAGADVVYTCTFGANRLKLGQYGVKDIKGVNAKLARIAKRTAGKNVLVAGDIGPTGKFIEPFGSIQFEDAVKIFKEQVRGLLRGGVDLFVIETMIDIQEARAALIAVKELTNKFTIVSMTYEKNGRTLNGTDPVSALNTLQSLGADAVGCNCSTGPEQMMKFIEMMKPYATVPVVAKPNAGMPRLVKGATVFDMSARKFSSFGKGFVKRGVNIIGGCCGTTPDHIAQLQKKIKRCKPVLEKRKSLPAVSSARKNVILDGEGPVVVIGECINPTGKKALQKELRTGKTSLVRQLAKDQERRGADMLDVNVGAPGVDEEQSLRKVMGMLCVSTDLPLVIDSSNSDAIAQCLRVYPGRALINSISAERKKLRKLLPIAKKYGAMFILLPLSDRGVPMRAEGRKKNVYAVWKKAKELGFNKSDIIVDGIAMTVSADPKSAIEALTTIQWGANVFKTNTVIGLSNISFGMPNRQWIDASFLSMAKSRGLTTVIANPFNEEVMNVKRSADLLSDADIDAESFISHFSQVAPAKKVSAKKNLRIEQKIFNAVIEGNREDILKLVTTALKEGKQPQTLVHDVMIPAINEVGDKFDKKEYFLPQLIASAETMKIAFSKLEPFLERSDAKAVKKNVVILATVKGDIHDIGKNIVGLMLKNHGFNVIDLGKDVSSSRLIKEIKRHKSPIVGLSALMTTTMVNMKEVVDKAGAEELNCRFILGGAVVTEAYARSMGAEYAHDGVSAVKIAKKITS